MERRTSEAAAGAFGSLYLLFLSSPVASLAAGVQTSGFAAHASCSSLYVGVCVCECGGRTSFPPISPISSSIPQKKRRRHKGPQHLPACLSFLVRLVPVLMTMVTMTMMVMIGELLCSPPTLVHSRNSTAFLTRSPYSMFPADIK